MHTTLTYEIKEIWEIWKNSEDEIEVFNWDKDVFKDWNTGKE